MTSPAWFAHLIFFEAEEAALEAALR